MPAGDSPSNSGLAGDGHGGGWKKNPNSPWHVAGAPEQAHRDFLS